MVYGEFTPKTFTVQQLDNRDFFFTSYFHIRNYYLLCDTSGDVGIALCILHKVLYVKFKIFIHIC